MSGVSTATVMAGLAVASTVASVGMSIAGSMQQADAQRMAGEAAYRNALQRNEMLQAEARQREARANAEQAASQRAALEKRRESRLAASRAQAVMAASGAGVDNNIIDGILGEGELAFDTALYEGDSKAQNLRYDATLRRWEGQTHVAEGGRTRAAMQSRAASTETMGIVGGATKLASLASKYAPGDAPGVSAASPASTMSAYGGLSLDQRMPGFAGLDI